MKVAKQLSEISSCFDRAPLAPDDEKYHDLTAARGSDELQQLRLQIRDSDAAAGRFAKIVLCGYRGSGKTTELRRLGHELGDRFTPLYFPISNHVLRDCDILDLLVWLVENLIRQYSIERWPLDSNVVIAFTDWISRRSFDDVEVVKEEIRSESGTDLQAEYGFYWTTIQILNRIKSKMAASSTHRQNMRERLHSYTEEFVYHVNLLLDDARATLTRIDRKPDLVILQDNLDHMSHAAARRIFFDSADILKSLRVHHVATAPMALNVPPLHISNHFEHTFTLPLANLRDSTGKEGKAGVKGLLELIGKRADVKKTFESTSVLQDLATMSGGNPRDLMSLVNYAQRAARISGKRKIDRSSADVAMKRLSAYYEKLLIPHEVFYPLIFRIDQTKRGEFLANQDVSPDGVIAARNFASELLDSGAILTDTSECASYDVHPAVREIDDYKEFCAEQLRKEKTKKNASNAKVSTSKKPGRK